MKRCRFCRRRLNWDVPSQEWVHRDTGEVQGSDGHYAVVRIGLSPWMWLLVALMLAVIVGGVVDLLFD